MKLHCKTRLNSKVRLTLRDGTLLFWTFKKEHRNWVEFAEGRVEKARIRAFVSIPSHVKMHVEKSP